jgi:hypothetical protein
MVGSHSGTMSSGAQTPGTVAVGTVLNGSSAFAFSIWTRSTGTAGRLLSEPTSAGLTIAQNGSALRITASAGFVNANLDCTLCNDAQGSWYHHVITAYGGNYYWYVNGELNKTGATTGNLVLPGNLTVGGQNINSSRWVGNVDELAVWSTGLTKDEVQLLYNRQKQKVSGQHESAVIDLGSTSATWAKLTPVTAIPFFKELPTSSEATAAYSGISANLMSQLAALWHFNESAWSGAANEAVDELGSASGARVGNTNTLSPAPFDRGATFDGTTDGINLADKAALEFTTAEKSFSFWMRPLTVPSAGSSIVVMSKWNITGNNREWSLYFDSADNLLKFTKSADGTGSNGVELGAGQQEGIASTFALSNTVTGLWHHVLVTIAADKTVAFYVNGKAAGGGTLGSSTVFAGTANAHIGCIANNGTACGNSFRGMLDEVAVWNRALSSAEALQLYRRGANRVKFQVKSCADSNCNCKALQATTGTTNDCDGDGTANATDTSDANAAIWLGPDGTAATYFSELQNYNTVVNSVLSGGVSSASSDHTFTNYTAAARPGANRYFRVRTYLESDDDGAACGGSNCLPELASATISPTSRYYAGSPPITNVTGVAYSKAKSFVVSRAGSCTPTYQISRDGTNFFYWNAGAWAAATTSAQSSFEGDIHANISSFPAGSLFFKAFLPSDMSQSCEIRSVISEIER